MSRGHDMSLVENMKKDRIDASFRFRMLSEAQQVEQVRTAPVSERYDIITLVEDATPIVQALSIPDLHVLVSHEDLHSRVQSLLEVASPEQLRGVMDFICWEGDEPDTESTFEWLEWLMGLSDDKLRDRLAALDCSFLAAVLGPHLEVSPDNSPGEFTVIATRIIALPTGFDYDDALVEWFFMRVFETDRTIYDELINRIFRDDWTEHRATHGAVADQLSEAAFERARRLRELELGDTYEARASLLQPLEVHPSRVSYVLATDLPARVVTEPILDAIARIAHDPEQIGAWSISLAKLAGDVVMARGRDPGNPRDLRHATAFTRSAVNVALDTLSGGSPWFAIAIVETWGWRTLFRVGNTLIDRLRWRVDSIRENDVRREEDRVFLEGLFRVPMKVYDAASDTYRLPQFAVDLSRAHRTIHRIQFERGRRR